MSPFANSLFVVACAALLSTAYGSGCASAGIGEYTGVVVNLQRYILGTGQRDAVINVVDNCALQHKGVMVGEQTSACDYIVAPDVQLGPAFSPITVHRNAKLDDTGYVDIVQYCK